MKFKYKLLFIFIILWIISGIQPLSPFDWFAENILVAGFLVFLALTNKKLPLSNLSYTMIFFFLSMHIMGAHYGYGHVPLGIWIQDLLSLSRNPFDRIVHLTFGLLLVIPIQELLERMGALGKKYTTMTMVLIMIGLGSIYELIEALTSVIMRPEQLSTFLASQGDVWDAQKDVAMAGLGAWITLVFYNKFKKTHSKKVSNAQKRKVSRETSKQNKIKSKSKK